jgi:hypothetical protein
VLLLKTPDSDPWKPFVETIPVYSRLLQSRSLSLQLSAILRGKIKPGIKHNLVFEEYPHQFWFIRILPWFIARPAPSRTYAPDAQENKIRQDARTFYFRL